MTEKIACYKVWIQDGKFKHAKSKAMPAYVDGYATAAIKVNKLQTAFVAPSELDNFAAALRLLLQARRASA